jgi:hypothetical protein
LNLKPATGLEIVRLLERYNLSDTSEDIKGIAFERFLGRTFRGEIGQFFTPRPIVEFMVRMVEPKEGDIICDPASGSGGFLIRFFEIVREQILADADRQYQKYRAKIDADKKLSAESKAIALRTKFDEIQATLDPNREGSRLWTLANRCIYGTDANDRMARTSKMNMIMHGDGHGGVHHHDGFLNVNGIFEGRFDIILTNPPFGANVEPSDKVLEEQMTLPDEIEREYARTYGNASLLFMQKFGRKEQADFDAKMVAAEKETHEKYAPEIAKRTQELQAGIEQANQDRNAERRKALQKELHDYQRQMKEKIEREARALLKARFPYPIFLYEADHVGITATGETDRVPNELVPNEFKPADVEQTTLELYLNFKADPAPFLLAGPHA